MLSNYHPKHYQFTVTSKIDKNCSKIPLDFYINNHSINQKKGILNTSFPVLTYFFSFLILFARTFIWMLNGSSSVRHPCLGHNFSETVSTVLWVNINIFYQIKRIVMDWMFCQPPLSNPQFICWGPNPQYDSIWRWDVWEVIMFRRGHKGGTPMMRLVSS